MRSLLWPFAFLYRGVIGARNLYYDHFPGATHHADLPVISVGNLTVGGTGKTPLVIDIARKLRHWGRRPAILTRGYKAPAGGTADEVLEFHDALPDVPVIVSPDRVAGAAHAQHQHNADCVVLDDGFQHRRLARDLDIVLISAFEKWSRDLLLPAGRLREPPRSLRRAGVLVITRANQVPTEQVDTLATDLQRCGPNMLVVRTGVEPADLVTQNGQRTPLAHLAGRRVLAVCGLGDPRTFAALLSGLGCADVGLRVFADHHRYNPADVAALDHAARREHADLVVTTRKDWVKLAPLWPAGGPELVRLDVRLTWLDATDPFDARLRQAVEMHR